MTWTPQRHAEHKRTLAMLTRCAGNADGVVASSRMGGPRQGLIVAGERFRHPVIVGIYPIGEDTPVAPPCVTYCDTARPAEFCTCGAYALEWR